MVPRSGFRDQTSIVVSTALIGTRPLRVITRVSAWKATYDSGYKRKLEAFVDRGAIAEKDGRWVTTEDIVFSSPSAAAAVVFGRSSNGREAWIHVASGQTYGEFQLSLLTQE